MNVDSLTPRDLDQLSRLIVDALQVVDKDKDKDQGRNRGPLQARPGPRDLGGRLTDEEEEEEGAESENEEEERGQENAPVTPAELQGHLVILHEFIFLHH